LGSGRFGQRVADEPVDRFGHPLVGRESLPHALGRFSSVPLDLLEAALQPV
jgi:hypothetical protein